MNTEIPVFRADGTTDHAAAFHAEPVHEWKGRPIVPWTIDHECWFHALRAVAGAPPMGELLRSPGAFLGDSVRILFLASHDDAGIRAMARGGLDAAASRWSAENVTLADAPAALGLGLRIYNEAHANDVEPVRESEAEPPGE